MDKIESPHDLRPGDIALMGMDFAPARPLVYAGQALLGEYVRLGKFVVGHAAIITEALHDEGPSPEYPTGVINKGALVQAMPRGAEEVRIRSKHWSPGVLFVRPTEDYPGQAADAAAIARLMVTEGTPYSFRSYAALAAWRFGLKAARLERWIDRRVEAIGPAGSVVDLPAEAICSVLVDQAWSLTGKRICRGVARQAVTPGKLALDLWHHHRDASWGGMAFL